MKHKEWKVLLNGRLYTDRFDSREEAEEYIIECVIKGKGEMDEFTIELMTHEEIRQYYPYYYF